jgi:Pyruvate/2-oxoacid:ferredoxin oxidoreductase gamma subunit
MYRERALLLSGIGGQGIQLAAKTLAEAAVRDGREALVFGSYGGMMRGGNTDATVIVANQPVTSPPVIDEAWAALVMHHQGWPNVSAHLMKDAFVQIDGSVFRGECGIPPGRLLDVPATDLASKLGIPRAAAMYALGAFAAATGIATLEALTVSAREALPSYRRQHAEDAVRAIREGYASVGAPRARAWEGVSAGAAA